MDMATIMQSRPVNDSEWKSQRSCCKEYKDLLKRLEDEKNAEPKQTKPDATLEPFYFQMSDSGDNPPFVRRQPPKPETEPRLLSELWKPIDARDDVINIYKTSKEEQERVEIIPDEGFILPCQRDKHCVTQRRMNLNEFYLQSKDFHRFNMNFKYWKNYYVSLKKFILLHANFNMSLR